MPSVLVVIGNIMTVSVKTCFFVASADYFHSEANLWHVQ